MTSIMGLVILAFFFGLIPPHFVLVIAIIAGVLQGMKWTWNDTVKAQKPKKAAAKVSAK